MKRLLLVVLLVAGAAAAYWRYAGTPGEGAPAAGEREAPPPAWLKRLYSQNPKEVETATRELEQLGANALPMIQQALRDPHAEAETLKGALKAVGILGRTAAPLVNDVAEVLSEPALTAEAAVALSFMGRGAFGPLREALSSSDPIVRREALRSIGKLKERAPLEADVAVPLLIARLKDRDPGVRAVAATYLGIIHERPADAIPALIAALGDEDDEVRRAAAAALGSFEPALAAPALPALRKASSDRNPDVAREAGQTIVKLQAR
jgi:HEAT repeat protein